MKPKPRTRHTLAFCGVAAALAAGSTAFGQLEIPTSFGSNGADYFLTNDGNRAANVATGDRTGVEVRNYPTVRQKVGVFRFDLNELDPASVNTNATLRLQAWAANRTRTWQVYGLRDGHTEQVYDPGLMDYITVDEFWPELTTSYNLSPGIIDSDGDETNGKGLNDAPAVDAFLDVYDPVDNADGAWQLVGTAVDYAPAAGGAPAEMPGLDLGPFIDADTNGVVTLLVTYDVVNNQGSFGFTSKEDPDDPVSNHPTLVIPSGSWIDADMDGLPRWWEVLYSLDDSDNGTTNEDFGPAGDPDEDTYDNAAELAAGTDPQDDTSVPGDRDSDGLQDLWEDANFGDNDGDPTDAELLLQDGTGDPDSDWGTNEDEETAGTNPNERDSAVDANAFVDSEPDGQNDWWEIHYFGDINYSTAGTDDLDTDDGTLAGAADPDGADNDTEYANYSNPLWSASVAGDIDGDGQPDLWEDQYFGNNDGIITDVDAATDLDASDGTGDPDEDTFTDLQESTAMPVASDPNNPASIPGDADADDLGDDYEIDQFSDITTQTGLQDTDGDGYRNSEEEDADPQTDAWDIDSFIDDDNDGLNDRWEIRYFGATDLNDEDGDSDDDGFFDEDEYFDGSNPNDPNSFFGDVDADGLDDDWELGFWNFATPSVASGQQFKMVWDQDGDDDFDGDFATNEEEESDTTDNPSPADATSAPDSDTDGLGDAWEEWSYGEGNLTATELGTDDTDTDGEDSDTEFANLTNANDPLSTSDTDADRLPDGWEIDTFIMEGEDPVTDAATILARQTGADDTDADGAINLLELRLGTDANDVGDVPDPIRLSTADGQGADIDLANDTQSNGPNFPTVQLGDANGMALRYIEDTRVHIPMIRFETGFLEGDLSGILLQINTTFEISDSTQAVEVYALNDGADGEDWDESTTSYSTAPGILFGEEMTLSTWSRDPEDMKYVGTIVLPNTGLGISDPKDLDLESLIMEDTDGLLTLALFPSNGGWFGISTKEDGTALAPTLIAPNATLSDTDMDGLPNVWEITNFGNFTDARGTEAQDAGLGADWDNDGDGDDNATEYANGTDPNDKTSFFDSEPDGLPDQWELDTFGDLDEDAQTDTDLDGFPNIDEFFAGTNANDINDVPVIPPATMIHQWTFNDGTFTDQVGTLDGTLGGNATIAGGSLVLDEAGDTGDLDGAQLAINTYESVTIEAWATPSAANTGFNSVFICRDTNQFNDDWAANYLMIQTHRGDDVSRATIATNNLGDAPWTFEDGVNGTEITGAPTHYVLVFNHTIGRLEYFINGVSQGSVTTSQSLADVGTEVAQIGTAYPADPTWQGTVDEVTIHNGALNGTQVLAAYNAGPIAGSPDELKVTNVTFGGTQVDVTVSGLDTTGTYELVRGTGLDDITTVVDTIVNPTAEDTFTDDTPPAGTAYYIVRDQE